MDGKMHAWTEIELNFCFDKFGQPSLVLPWTQKFNQLIASQIPSPNL